MMIDIASPIATGHPLNHGLQAWWLTLPQLAGGNTWHDLTGRNPGTLTGMGTGYGWQGTTRQGGFGELKLDGSNDYVDLGDNFDMGLNSLSVSCWFKTVSSASQVFVSKSHAGGANGRWWMYSSPSNTIEADLEISGLVTTVSTSATGYLDGKWHHVIAIWNRQSTIDIYLDGKYKASSASIAAASGNDFQTSDACYISNYGGTSTNYVAGSMDDVRIYNRALSASEIFQLYNLSRLGYPGLLNRVDEPLWTSQALGLLLARRRAAL